ncbi:hypothetical protein [Herbaspirillum sp. alder98]|uniref:hypothetical protein n=1 Tax=Herbaspirillum sp. alder98 TaxID=2913096 RepID=UPI001CD8CAD9|nr:hypothetical protein [Herbaspirillum sp. alder98]MCA1326134.1 hypothetical protein [Herbaspirillum sp. alder98]
MTSFYKNSLEDPYFLSDGETLRVLIWRGRRLVVWRLEFWLKASNNRLSVVFCKRFRSRECSKGTFLFTWPPCYRPLGLQLEGWAYGSGNVVKTIHFPAFKIDFKKIWFVGHNFGFLVYLEG